MKKKLFGMLLAATLILAQTATVFAAGSAAATEQGTKDAIASVEASTELSDSQKADVTSKLLSAEKNDVSGIASAAGESVGTVKEAIVTDATAKTHVVKVTPLSNVNWRAFHFSIARKIWEEVKVEVNSTGEVLTAYLDDLSPVVFVAEEVQQGGKKKHHSSSSSESTAAPAPAATVAADGGVITSPKTGVSSDWAVWMMSAVVLGGISVAAFRRRRA